MRLTIQPGIETASLQEAIRQTIVAGVEADAAGRRKVYEARVELAKKAGVCVSTPEKWQGSLFEEVEP